MRSLAALAFLVLLYAPRISCSLSKRPEFIERARASKRHRSSLTSTLLRNGSPLELAAQIIGHQLRQIRIPTTQSQSCQPRADLESKPLVPSPSLQASQLTTVNTMDPSHNKHTPKVIEKRSPNRPLRCLILCPKGATPHTKATTQNQAKNAKVPHQSQNPPTQLTTEQETKSW